MKWIGFWLGLVLQVRKHFFGYRGLWCFFKNWFLHWNYTIKMVLLSTLKVTNRAKQKFSNNRLKILICAKILYNCAKTGFHLRNCDPYRGWFSGNIPLIIIFITVVKCHNPKSTIEQQYCSYFSCWGQWLLTWSSFSKLCCLTSIASTQSFYPSQP